MDQKRKEQYIEKKQDPSLKLFVVLSKAYRSVFDQVAKDIKGHGLNTTDFAVMELLYHKGEQPLQKIGDRILLASGSITYVVDKLEKKELVKRIPCPNDRRITYASITEKGEALLNDIFPSHWERIEVITDGLEVQEKLQTIQLLKQLGVYADDLEQKQ